MVAKIPRVSHVDRVPLTTLDGSRDVLAADRRLDDILHVGDQQPMPRDRLAIDADVGEVALRDRFRIDTPRTGDTLQQTLDLTADALDFIQIRTENLDPDRS